MEVLELPDGRQHIETDGAGLPTYAKDQHPWRAVASTVVARCLQEVITIARSGSLCGCQGSWFNYASPIRPASVSI
jgi:hypothetical protein